MLSGYIESVRKEEPNTLYVIAGDMFRGSVIDSEYKGLSTIEIMNALAPDVVTIGNHEVDTGSPTFCLSRNVQDFRSSMRIFTLRIRRPDYLLRIRSSGWTV